MGLVQGIPFLAPFAPHIISDIGEIILLLLEDLWCHSISSRQGLTAVSLCAVTSQKSPGELRCGSPETSSWKEDRGFFTMEPSWSLMDIDLHLRAPTCSEVWAGKSTNDKNVGAASSLSSPQENEIQPQLQGFPSLHLTRGRRKYLRSLKYFVRVTERVCPRSKI